MKVAQRIVLGSIVTAAVLVITALVMPLPQATLLVRGDLALVAVMATINIGAALLFISGLHDYKAEMRKAYRAFASGVLILAFGSLQVAVLVAFSLDTSNYARGIGVVLPFLLTGLLIYIGLRRFARLVGVRSWLTRAILVLPVVIMFSALSSQLPHAPGLLSTEVDLDFSTGILFWITLLNFISALLIYQVNRRIGSHYVQAMTLLQTFLLGSSAISLFAIVVNLTVVDSGKALTITHLLSVGLAFVSLRAGYAFTRTEEY